MYIRVLSEPPNGVFITLRPYMPLEPKYPQELAVVLVTELHVAAQTGNRESVSLEKPLDLGPFSYDLTRAKSANGLKEHLETRVL